MKKIIFLILAFALSLSLCACGGEKSEGKEDVSVSAPVVNPETGSDQIDLDDLELVDPESEPVQDRFSLRNDVHFGDSMDEVAAKEQVLDIDYESAGEDGYIYAQAKDGIHSTLTFEGIEDANLFYCFDAKTEQLDQVIVMFGHGGEWSTALGTYEELLKVYFDHYGVHLTDEQEADIASVDTIGHERATTHYEDTQMKKHTRWLLNDAEDYVILDVTTSLMYGDSYYTFVGMRHVTEEEISTSGGDLTAILQE